MDQTNTSSSNINVEELVKNLDLTKLHALTYDELQELAQKFLASEDPEVHAIGQELKSTDPSMFEFSQAEKGVLNIHQLLINMGKSKSQADLFGIQLIETATEFAISTIVGGMNEETRNEWDNLNAYGPNYLQQIYLLDQTSKSILGKSFDDIYEEGLNRASHFAMTVLKSKGDIKDKLQELDAQQTSNVLAAINANQFEIAVQLIFDYSQQNGTR